MPHSRRFVIRPMAGRRAALTAVRSARTAPSLRSGFTLVELLVVVSIIALLISILLPALDKARVHARDVVCRSNLRQVGVGTTYYHSDFQNLFPTRDALGRDGIRFGYGVNGQNHPKPSDRVDQEEDMFGIPSLFANAGYLSGNKVYLCPGQSIIAGGSSWDSFSMRDWGNTYNVNTNSTYVSGRKFEAVHEEQTQEDPRYVRARYYWAVDNWFEWPGVPGVMASGGNPSWSIRYQMLPHKISAAELAYGGDLQAVIVGTRSNMFDVGGVNLLWPDASVDHVSDQLRAR